MHLQFISFPHTDKDTSSGTLSLCEARTNSFYIISIMGADVLATQGAGASATMVVKLLNLDNSVPAC